MRPDPSQLRRYQLSPLARNGGPVGAFVGGANRARRQWRILLLFAVLLSVTFTFGFWTFQSDGFVFSPPYQKLEQFATMENAFTTTTQNKAENATTKEGKKNERANGSYVNFPPMATEEVKLLEANYPENVSKVTPNVSATFAIPPRHSNASGRSLLPLCPHPPRALVGQIPVWMDEPGFDTLSKLYPGVKRGGHNWPEECTARHRVAIIIPYRDRESHLRIFLHNLHFLLSKQKLDYAIFIIEQVTKQTFNRGKLMNVGFAEASRLYDWQCFIFHDVDLLPEDDRNLYSCPEQPRHMSVAVDKFNYTLPYAQIFGGATAINRSQFSRMNGFSNNYWGWGGEDDDMAYRIAYAGYKVIRYPSKIARYKMIKHEQDEMNPSNDCRWELLGKTKTRWHHDGLSSLNYSVLSTTFHRLYTNIVVDLLEDDSRRALADEHISKRRLKGC